MTRTCYHEEIPFSTRIGTRNRNWATLRRQRFGLRQSSGAFSEAEVIPQKRQRTGAVQNLRFMAAPR